MPRFWVDIDAAVSDLYLISAKNRAEAKRKAVKRFCKVKNFRFYTTKVRKGETIQDARMRI